MTLQYEIVAPSAGVVRSVQVAAGTRGAGGVPLVTLQDEAGTV